MAKINIAAEAGNVTDDDAQVHELLSMGLANDVFAGAKPVLLPNVKEKKANGFHERRFVRGQSGARASLTTEGVRVRSTMRVGVMGDAGLRKNPAKLV